MGYKTEKELDDFEVDIQCEELWAPLPSLFGGEESEDIMDRCPVFSLNVLGVSIQAYTMEDKILEEEEFADLWDVPFDMDRLREKFDLRRAYI